MEAGFDLFGTAGYADTSIELLCRAAKVTPRFFYEYFSSRERLLAAVYDRTSMEVLSRVIDALATIDASDPLQTIRAGTEAFFTQLFNDPRKARILCVETVGVSAEIDQSRRSVLHRFAGLIADRARTAIGDPTIPPGTFDIVALAYVGGINELVIDHLFGFIETPADTLVDEVSQLLMDGASGVYLRWRHAQPPDERRPDAPAPDPDPASSDA
jgi:AcrR family transcriptional regulator